MGWGGSVHCAWHASALSIGFWLAFWCVFIGNANHTRVVFTFRCTLESCKQQAGKEYTCDTLLCRVMEMYRNQPLQKHSKYYLKYIVSNLCSIKVSLLNSLSWIHTFASHKTCSKERSICIKVMGYPQRVLVRSIMHDKIHFTTKHVSYAHTGMLFSYLTTEATCALCPPYRLIRLVNSSPEGLTEDFDDYLTWSEYMTA